MNLKYPKIFSHHEFLFFSTAVTSKIRSRSPKSYQFFLFELHIHENLVRILPLVHKIYREESVTSAPTLTGSTLKSI